MSERVVPQSQDSFNLDLLRTIAVLAVLVDHGLEFAGKRLGIDFHPVDWRMGRLGVLLFFVHTALVLMLSLQRLHASGEGSVFRRFMIRRVFRIYPLSILVVLTMVAFRIPAMGWQPAYEVPTPGAVAASLLLVQNLTYSPEILSALWSLPLEMQMYLTLPLIFVIIAGRGALAKVSVLFGLAVVAGLLQSEYFGRLSLALFGPCFMAGVVAYVLSSRVRPWLPSWSWPLAIFAVMGSYFALAGLSSAVHPPVVAWASCLALGILIPQFKEIRQRFVCRSSNLVARYSYGIYLSHVVLMWFVFINLPPLPLAIQIALVLSMLIFVPVLLYHFVEAPCMRVGARLARRIGSRRVASPTQSVPAPAAMQERTAVAV